MHTSLSWHPDPRATDDDLNRARAYYGRSIRKLVSVLRDGSAPRCRDTVERLDRAGLLTHPYVVEWFNRQRAQLEGPERARVFATFDELPDLERRVAASELRRARSGRTLGAPFDFQTPSSAIPHAIRHLRAVSAEASDEARERDYGELDIEETPDTSTLSVVSDAWTVLNRFWPEVAAEIRAIIRTFSFFADDFVIGGALQSFLGGIFLCKKQATDGVKLGEEIVHEAAHARLFLMQLDRVLWTNPDQQRYTTVLRRDPRPFWGLYHQLFVLTRLTEYYGRVVREHPDRAEMYEAVRTAAEQAIDIVDEIGELTDDGARLFESMRAAVKRAALLAASPPPALVQPAPSAQLPAIGIRLARSTLPEVDRDVLASAFQADITLVDLADSSRDAASLDAAGALVRASLDTAGLDRRRLVTMAHIGAIPEAEGAGSLNDGGFMALLAVRYIKTGLLDWDDIVWFDHTWAPGFLERQLRDVLERLSLGFIDRVLLEGPELLWRNLLAPEARRRCRDAFARMEELVAAGLVGAYGVSLWDAAIPIQNPATLDLPAIVACAEEAGGAGHHLRSFHASLDVGDVGAFAERLVEAHRRGLEVSVAVHAGEPADRLAAAPPSVQSALAEQGLVGDTERLLQLARSVPGISSIVFGARTREAVREASGLQRRPRLAPELALDFYRARQGDA
jgi:hypothetical protein